MAEHILVPIDGSTASQHAVEYAREQFPAATLTLLYVMDPMVDYSRRRAYPGYTLDDEFKNEHEKGEHVLESAVETLPEDVSVETEIVAGSPGKTITDYADANDVDQIVIGSHGREGISRFLLGSVAETVVRRSAVPATVVQPNEEQSDTE